MPSARDGVKSCFGIKFYQSGHPKIRQIKRIHTPGKFGFRTWTSCWLLMDYLKTLSIRPGLNIMEVGCGWGLAGIFCAGILEAKVICVDSDSEVFPFLRAHAKLNQAQVSILHKRFEDLTSHDFANIELLIASDICFWDDMPVSIMAMIEFALACQVPRILIADPGRTPFQRLSYECVSRFDARVFNHSVRKPHLIGGRILKITNGSYQSH